MLTEPVHLLAARPRGARGASAGGSAIVLITKGDLVHQTRKVTTSGLEHHFTDIEILLEKDPETYAKILQAARRRARTVPDDRQLGEERHPAGARTSAGTPCTCRITSPGRSNGSTDHDEDFAELASIADLPAWLGLA